MTIALQELARWRRVGEQEAVRIDGPDKVRQVRLEFNVTRPTQVFLLPTKGEPVFLATVDGREDVTFVTSGPVTFMCSGPTGTEVYYYAKEAEKTSVVVPDAVAFTTIAQRQPRNHDLELMMFKMEQNMQKRLRNAAAEMERKFRAAAEQKAQEPAKPADKPAKPAKEKDAGDGRNSGAVEGVGRKGAKAPQAEGERGGVDGDEKQGGAEGKGGAAAG